MSNKNTDWETHFQEGNSLANAGKHHNAIKCFELVLGINPTHNLSWNNIGVALICLGKYQDALPNFDKAINIEPNYKEAYHNRGLALIETGQLQKALKDLSKSIELDDTYWSAYRHRSILYQMLKKPNESFQDYLSAKNLESKRT